MPPSSRVFTASPATVRTAMSRSMTSPQFGLYVTDAVAGQRVARGRGWPSTDTDVLGRMLRLRLFLPVGFYYKVFARPIWLWPRIEPLLRSSRASATSTSGRRHGFARR